jgi:hypothetical protein
MTQDFYHQPHIFVVFRPGSAGNLISSLLDNLLNHSLNDIIIAESGNAHSNSIVNRKRNGVDHISLGSGIADIDIKFFTAEEKLNFYKDKIESFPYDNRPYVTWTHDFTNIDLYKILFPNSKIFEITNDSLYEKIMALLFHVNKNIFELRGQSPLGDLEKVVIEIIKKKTISHSFNILYPDKRYQPGHDNLDLHLLYSFNLSIQGLIQHLGRDLNSEFPYEYEKSDDSLTWLERKIINSFNKHNIESSDFKLPLKTILQDPDRNVSNIVNVFNGVLNRTLNISEVNYIHSSISNYISSQNSFILQNPVRYINEVKEKADTIVSAF